MIHVYNDRDWRGERICICLVVEVQYGFSRAGRKTFQVRQECQNFSKEMSPPLSFIASTKTSRGLRMIANRSIRQVADIVSHSSSCTHVDNQCIEKMSLCTISSLPVGNENCQGHASQQLSSLSHFKTACSPVLHGAGCCTRTAHFAAGAIGIKSTNFAPQ